MVTAAEIYKNNFARLCAIVYRRCRNQATAQDIVHDAWIKVLEHGKESAVAYWSQAAINLAIDYGKTVSNRDRLNAKMVVADLFHSHEGALARSQQMERFIETLTQLEALVPVHVRAFRLRFEKSMTWKDIAKELGMSERYAQDHVSQVVQHCRERCS